MSSNIEIDEKLIEYLEDLSFLSFSDDEKSRLKRDLKDILANMALLAEYDLENVPVCSHPFSNVNAFREDTPQESFDREQILKNAPDRDTESFIVPKTVA